MRERVRQPESEKPSAGWRRGQTSGWVCNRPNSSSQKHSRVCAQGCSTEQRCHLWDSKGTFKKPVLFTLTSGNESGFIRSSHCHKHVSGIALRSSKKSQHTRNIIPTVCLAIAKHCCPHNDGLIDLSPNPSLATASSDHMSSNCPPSTFS